MSPMKKMLSDCQDAGVQPMGGSEEAIAEPQQFFNWEGGDGTSSTIFFLPQKTARNNAKKLGKLLSRKRPETGMLVGM